MKLIVGLGNPGKKYEKTRHNAGFLAMDKIASVFDFAPFMLDGKFNAKISKNTLNNEKTVLFKPQTFMNDSGRAVRAVMDYYKINIEDLMIIHDDLDIPLGKYKTTRDRSSAGHKGVQSIIDSLGTKNFTRIRIGIGIENKKTPTEKFVLENFSNAEMEIIEKVSCSLNC